MGKIPLKELQDIARRSKSVSDVYRSLEIPLRGAKYHVFYKRVAVEGIDITHFEGVPDFQKTSRDVSSKKGKVRRTRTLQPSRSKRTGAEVFGHRLCSDCSEPIATASRRCPPCAKVARRKVRRPSLEVLRKELKTKSYLQLGRKYGVSDNAIRKWFKLAGEKPPRKRKGV